LASFTSTACFLTGGAKKKSRIWNPPPIAAKTAPPEPPPAEIIMPEEEPQEALASTLEDLSTARPVFPPPPAPAPAKRPPVASAPKQAPPTATPEPTTPAAPRLGQIFTAEQAREYTKLLDEYADRTKRNLLVLERKRLTAVQGQTMETIRTFLKQAEQARD